MPSISIILPTLNIAATIGATIESIASQTHKDFELLVLDNKSGDETVSIVKRYDSQINSLRIFIEQDAGIYDAMNKGIGYATGDYLYFLGGDDTLFDDRVFEKVFSTIDQPYDFIYGNVLMGDSLIPYDGEFDLMKLLTKQNLCHQSIFYSRSIFQQVGGYNKMYKVWADWDLNIRCFKIPNVRVKYIDTLIAIYSRGGFSAGFANDELLLKELPIYYMDKLANLKSRILKEIHSDN